MIRLLLLIAVLPSCTTGPAATVKVGSDGVSASIDFVRRAQQKREEMEEPTSIVNTQNIDLFREK